MYTVFLEKICRCCLNEGDHLTDLFEKISENDLNPTKNNNFTYSDAMLLCANVRCDVDVVDVDEQVVELPKKICDVCIEELRVALLFRTKCETSDSILREQIIRSSPAIWVESSSETKQKIKPETQKMINYDEKSDNKSTLNKYFTPKVVTKQLDIIENVRMLSPTIDTQKIDNCEYSVFSETFQDNQKVQKHEHCHQLKRYLCSICGLQFTTKQRLNVHKTMHTKNKKYECESCEKKFTSGSVLRSHRRIHTGDRPYRCDQCSLTFAQGNALKCHKRTHSGEKPYECLICLKKFSQNTILKTHMTLHTGKRIKCPDCDKLFSRASNLILHRREHTGEKPYSCNQCANRYKQKSHLDRHMDTHLGIKYTCNVCTKVYSKQWSLKVHMFTHSGKKPHQCDLCTAEFVRRDKYRNHLKSVHNSISKC